MLHQVKALRGSLFKMQGLEMFPSAFPHSLFPKVQAFSYQRTLVVRGVQIQLDYAVNRLAYELDCILCPITVMQESWPSP